ncbi:MAG: radical SAM protein [Deltaproteobacteria bacterium]|nr:radical SAM protein [Deltaproteobacteria bacterium]
MLNGIHFLLSYACNMECDHCFLFSGPYAKGTMTIEQIKSILKEAKELGTIDNVYFEGGEPFLFYPVMIEAIKLSKEMGFNAGIVSNGYWATDPDDAMVWLTPLSDLGISDLSVSNDSLHYGDSKETPAEIALIAAEKLNIPTYSLCKEKPEIKEHEDKDHKKGAPEISGGIKIRGRAVEKFAADLPKRSWEEFNECPYEELENPKRVHVDAYGNLHMCQGISMGNCSKTPLSKIAKEYNATKHPIAGPILSGGPAELVRKYDLKIENEFVDACHLCYTARTALLDRFDEFLAPKQVYGL